ncbi:MAG: hypothetical protein OSB55_12855 [Verrucomicrobiota bacterium]|nr:hypothetical protein [Mariniblastus sp.]MDE2643625.1 hypothetical protein [Verrucomicrobiota bacterium]
MMIDLYIVLAQGGVGIPWQGDDSWGGEHGSGGGEGNAICWMIFLVILIVL